MARTTINISIPEQMRLFVENKVYEANYGSMSEYFRELIRMDQRRELERMDAASERQFIRDSRTLSPAEVFDL